MSMGKYEQMINEHLDKYNTAIITAIILFCKVIRFIDNMPVT